MQNTILQEQLRKIASFKGIEIYNIKAEKFKTNTINILFHDNLKKESAAKNALIPAILRRGCERLPNIKDIALYLEELYGASFDCGITKKGESQIIQFYIEFISDLYTEKGSNLFNKTFDLVFDIITSPVVENNSFKNEYMEQEKENLKKLIESRVNDKTQYSIDRCFEEMCKNEPFGVYEYGYVSDLDSINGQDLYKYYKNAMETLPITIFITGNIDDDSLNRVIERISRVKRGEIKEISGVESSNDRVEVKKVEEKMDVNQGKLSLGFRTGITAKHNDYYALLVYNSILGGGMHSKLFQNVRERESLAYYVFSRLDKFKGLMIISGGIESQNRDKAQDIALKQMEEIKKGNISDYEFESAMKNIETGIKSLKDSQLHIMDFYLSQVVSGTNDTFDTIIEKVKKVKKEDVIRVSENIKLDTVYFLTK